MKITKTKLMEMIKEELEEATASYPLKNVDQDSVSAGEPGEQAVMQTKRAPNKQEEASQLFGDRMNIDSSMHAYRLGQHWSTAGADSVEAEKLHKIMARFSPHAAHSFILGMQHGFGDDD